MPSAPPERRTTRRAALLGGLALAGCRPATAAPPLRAPPLRRLAPFPLGVEITTAQLDDPAARALVVENFSEITPGLELKMEKILRPDGSLSFEGADRMVAFAQGHGLGVHGHTLIWYLYSPPTFEARATDPEAFLAAYRAYIGAVAGRYRGRVRGWDVVNEPVTEDGAGYRNCLWSRVLGMDYVARALDAAREADGEAVLLVNEYGLEANARKRGRFLSLVGDLLRRGAPIGGVGTQMHLDWRQDPRDVETMMREVASLGLPVHVSELDVSTHVGLLDPTPLAVRLERQADLVFTAARAFRALPAAQRYGFTAWDLRDKDSWLRTPYGGGDGAEAPTLFTDDGGAKPATAALAEALSGAQTLSL